MTEDNKSNSQTFTEQIEVSGAQLVERVKELVAEGNVRRLIFRAPDDTVMLEMTLTTAVVGGALTLAAPWLAAIGAVAALVTRMRIEVVRDANVASTLQDEEPDDQANEAAERLSSTGKQKVKIQVED